MTNYQKVHPIALGVGLGVIEGLGFLQLQLFYFCKVIGEALF